jgi:hypothetical protein
MTPAQSADLFDLGHQNLIDFWRHSTEWSSNSRLHQDDRLIMFATGSAVMHGYNGAFRLTPEVGGRELVDAADDFFLPLGLSYTIKVRDTGDDEDLRAACRSRKMIPYGEVEPEMALSTPPEQNAKPSDVDIQPVRTEKDVADLVPALGSAYGIPPEEVEVLFGHPSALLASPDVAGYIARYDNRPVGGALTAMTHDIGGVYWVGTVTGMRGRGIGEAISLVATSDIFTSGAKASTLQASPESEAIYQRMGYVTLYGYQTYLRVPRASSPSTSASPANSSERSDPSSS